MRKILLVASLLSIVGTASFAQCGKHVTLTSSRTEYLDANGTLERTEDEKSSIELSKTDIVIIPGNDQRKITGTIKSDTCNWKTPFKEGKSKIKATLNREGEETLNATITIEGKDGKITMLVEIEEMPDKKIRAVIEKFDEKK
jgi:hypothetical protein